MVRFVLLLAAVLTGIVLTGCITGDDDDSVTQSPNDSASQAGTPVPCPVTVPNGQTPPGEGPNPFHYGNGELWTTLWPDGTVPFEEDESEDGLIVEWPWWVGVDGELSITGQHLDDTEQSVSFELFGEPGADGFQPTVLTFSDGVCWEVTGQAGGASLTFVTRVVQP